MKTSQASDEVLFLRIKEGDTTSFNTLFTRYYKKLCYYSVRITNRGELSEEIIQELFIKIWENRESLIIENKVKSYLYRSAFNRSVNALRNNRSALVNDAEIQHPESYYNADNEILYFELEVKLFEIIDSFPEKQRNVFILKRFDNLSYKEIAAELDMSERMVEKYLSKSLTSLRKALSEYKEPFPSYFMFFL